MANTPIEEQDQTGWLVFSSEPPPRLFDFVVKQGGTKQRSRRAIKFSSALDALRAAKALKSNAPSTDILLANDNTLFTLLGTTYSGDGTVRSAECDNVVFEIGLFLDNGSGIGPGITGRDRPRSIDECWTLIDKYADAHPGEPVAEFAKALLAPFLPNVSKNADSVSSASPLPKRAPEKWPSDPAKRREGPLEFATRVYRPWMDAGVLTRQALKELDPLLFASVDNWLKNNRRKPKPEPLPAGFKLLTLAQANDSWIGHVEAMNPNWAQETAKLTSAKRRRTEKSGRTK